MRQVLFIFAFLLLSTLLISAYAQADVNDQPIPEQPNQDIPPGKVTAPDAQEAHAPVETQSVEQLQQEQQQREQQEQQQREQQEQQQREQQQREQQEREQQEQQQREQQEREQQEQQQREQQQQEQQQREQQQREQQEQQQREQQQREQQQREQQQQQPKKQKQQQAPKQQQQQQQQQAPSAGSNVVELNDSNFEDQTQAASGATTGDWLVEFYAPWCGHCKKLEPIWEQVASQLKGKVNVAKVNVDNNKKLAQRFHVSRFPTIKFFRGGKIYTFDNERSLEAITAYALGGYSSKHGEPVPATPSALEEFIDMATPYAQIAQSYAQQGLALTQVYATEVYEWAKVEFPRLYRLARSELDKQGFNLDHLDSIDVDEVKTDVHHIILSKKAAAIVLIVGGFIATVSLGFVVIVIHWFFQLLCGSSKSKRRVVAAKTVSTANSTTSTPSTSTTKTTKVTSATAATKKSPSKLTKTD